MVTRGEGRQYGGRLKPPGLKAQSTPATLATRCLASTRARHRWEPMKKGGAPPIPGRGTAHISRAGCRRRSGDGSQRQRPVEVPGTRTAGAGHRNNPTRASPEFLAINRMM
jgi:hypothetical protein